MTVAVDGGGEAVVHMDMCFDGIHDVHGLKMIGETVPALVEMLPHVEGRIKRGDGGNGGLRREGVFESVLDLLERPRHPAKNKPKYFFTFSMNAT